MPFLHPVRSSAALLVTSVLLAVLSEAGVEAQTFADIAHLDAPPCADDYSLVEDCYNPELPEPPSLERSLETPGNDDGEIRTWPEGELAPGKAWVMPNFRTTNDGRLFAANQGSIPGLGVFRPENLGYDALQKGDGNGWGENPMKTRQGLFPGTWLDVAETLFDLGPSAPPAYHNTLCDDSASSYDLESSIASGRNPRSCSAWVSLTTWPPAELFDPQNAELLDGDCYDISILVHAGKDLRWEMSTSDLTVFVPRAKQPDSGQPMLYIYPRMSEEPLPFNGNYSPFNFHFDGSTWDWSWTFERDKLFAQCVNKPASLRPPYCGYQDSIETSVEQGLVFDRDADGQIDPGELWNGNSCSAPDAGANCGPWALFEPSVTADGRLLVLNGEGLGLWYSYSENACSAAGWRFLRPVSAMPWDSRLQGRYGIAASPFRTTTGEILERPAPGQPFPSFPGAYPWIDRQGRNLFWAPINDARDGYVAINATPPCPSDTSDYQCAYEPDLVGQELVPDESPGKAISVVGAWTRGKIVHLDNRMNLSVFGNKRPKNRNSSHDFRHEWDMELYQGGPTHLAPLGATTLLSSENLYNAYDALSPLQPFDVVWTLSGNHQQSPEVVFDEYMSSNAFIVVSMNAPLTTFGNNRQPFWDDGFVPTHPEKSVRSHGPGSADFRYRRSPRLQNASTLPEANPLGLEPPASLELLGGARVEPVAAGGVIGNGLWLDGRNDFAHAEFPHPPIHDWYVGAWLDDRSDDGLRRTVFTFADGSRILYRQGELAAWHATSDTLRTLDISSLGIEKGSYFHLGVKVVTVGLHRRLYFYVNGTRLRRTMVFSAEPGHLAFDMTCLAPDSHFWLADPGGTGSRPPFRGWVDELRVYALGSAERPVPSWLDELSCNLALGTLVAIEDSDRTSNSDLLRALWQRAEDYGLFIRAELPTGVRVSRSSALAGKVPYGQRARVCEQLDVHSATSGPTDFAPQHGRHLCVDRVHRNPRPAVANRCLRTEVLATAGRELIADEPRPEFGDLPFCQSCHTSLSLIPELGPEALSAGALGLPRFVDGRRQPLDWPALLTGCRPTTAPFDDQGGCEPDPELLDFLLSGGHRIEPEP